VVLQSCRLEPSLKDSRPGEIFQFERQGYFCVDTKDSAEGAPMFNRTVTLRDSWAKLEKDGNTEKAQAPATRPAPKKEDSPRITLDDFTRVDLRVGLVREVSLVEGSSKLLKLMVDVGEDRLRQIFAGVRSAYQEPDDLLGKKVVVVANLKERDMRFGRSEGMILAAGEGSRMGVVTLDGDPKPGDRIT